MNRIHYSAILCALCAGPPLWAQTLGTYETTERLEVEVRPPATRAATGRFLGRRAPDAAVLFGDVVSIYIAPDVHTARLDLPENATDFAVLPPPTGGTGHDSLVTISGRGLEVWNWNRATRSFGKKTYSGDWVGGSKVWVHDLDGNGQGQAFGVDAQGSGLLVADVDAQNEISVPATIQFPSPVLDVVPLQWDSTPQKELAVLTSNRVYVVDTRFAIVKEFANWGAGVLAPMPMGRDADLQGLLTAAPFGAGGMDAVILVSSEEPMQMLQLPVGGVAGLSSIGRPSPASPSVVVSHGTSDDLLFLDSERDLNSPLQLNVGGTIEVQPWPYPSSNRLAALVQDLDFDGDDDILFAPSGVNRVDLIRDKSVDELQLTARPIDLKFTTTQSGEAVFKLSYDVTGLPWQDVEATVWVQTRFDQNISSSPWMDRSIMAVVDEDTRSIVITTPFVEFFEDVFYIEARMVDLAAGTFGPASAVAVGLGMPVQGALLLSDGEASEDLSFGLPADSPFLWPYPAGEEPPHPGGFNPLLPGEQGYEIIIGSATGGSGGSIPDLPPPPQDDPPSDGAEGD